MHQDAGFAMTGFQAIVSVAIWLGVVLVYGVYRSLGEAPQDSIRPSGPLD